MKKLLLIVIVLIIYGCDSPAKTDSLKTTNSANKTASNTPIIPTSNWSYSEDTNKMTSGLNYYAQVNANDPLELNAPYDGGVTSTLTIRHKEGENNVILSIERGQFNPGVDGETIRARFDDSKSMTFDCVGPADNSSTSLFINSTSKFIYRLKHAKTLIIEAEFFDNGLKEMEFNIAGFKWKH